MKQYVNNKRRLQNQRNIEERSDGVCFILIHELFEDEVNIIHNVLLETDLDKIKLSLNGGLVLSFSEGLDLNVIKQIRNSLHDYNIKYKLDKKEYKLTIFKD